ncbi:NADP-dependent oxidoreductase [Georgenia yuyongxinii]|uniref:NADP-dependent oxidoreductase n=1 Tax=Georgenia yuyongxinii TaxID=2589797 RepID=A0A5B8BZR1_9MICO|nr:NADP-dependent oxidoreductase [Georgenia yuyongxinii]QDC23297.1 NADP-dependent oxidoreductase [Georgenia yuyongxinii]
MSRVLVFREYGGPETQELVERDVPEPGAGEVRVAVRAAGVNPADWKRRSGRFGTKIALPAPMGLELAGVVESVGADVAGLEVGDAVLGVPARGWGALAEHTIARAEDLVPKPAAVSFVDAAALPVAGATAYDVVHQVPLGPGATLLVTGAGGGVGVIAVQLAVAVLGLRVIGTGSEAKRALLEELGAVFVASGPGVADRLVAAAPDGVDAVVDLVGGEALREAARLAREPAAVVSTADPAGARELGGAGVVRHPTRESLGALLGHVVAGHVRPRVSGVFPLERVAEAVAAVETGHATGKVVVEIG